MANEDRLLPALQRTWDDAERRLPAHDQLSHDGLETSVHHLTAADLVLIRLPPASHAAEAHFVGITFPSTNKTEHPSPIRYFVLEFGWELNDEPRTVLCEWTPDHHVNFGNGPPLEASAFIAAVADVLDRGHGLRASGKLP